MITHPMMISRDLADVEAFGRLCQRQGVHIHIRTWKRAEGEA
jgi:hypothetical protein